MTPNGVAVKLSKSIYSFVSCLHLADVPIKHPEKKFEAGQEIKCRVSICLLGQWLQLHDAFVASTSKHLGMYIQIWTMHQLFFMSIFFQDINFLYVVNFCAWVGGSIISKPVKTKKKTKSLQNRRENVYLWKTYLVVLFFVIFTIYRCVHTLVLMDTNTYSRKGWTW